MERARIRRWVGNRLVGIGEREFRYREAIQVQKAGADKGRKLLTKTASQRYPHVRLWRNAVLR